MLRIQLRARSGRRNPPDRARSSSFSQRLSAEFQCPSAHQYRGSCTLTRKHPSPSPAARPPLPIQPRHRRQHPTDPKHLHHDPGSELRVASNVHANNHPLHVNIKNVGTDPLWNAATNAALHDAALVAGIRARSVRNKIPRRVSSITNGSHAIPTTTVAANANVDIESNGSATGSVQCSPSPTRPHSSNTSACPSWSAAKSASTTAIHFHTPPGNESSPSTRTIDSTRGAIEHVAGAQRNRRHERRDDHAPIGQPLSEPDLDPEHEHEPDDERAQQHQFTVLERPLGRYRSLERGSSGRFPASHAADAAEQSEPDRRDQRPREPVRA